MSFFKPMKRIGSLLIILLIVPILFLSTPNKASAQWPVFDVVTETFQGSQFMKEFVGDSIANFIAKTIIQRLTAQTVNWINSGFKGNPLFVTNPDKFFLDTGDQVASHYLSLQGPLNQLCSPFKAQVRLALVKNYLQETSNQNTCTLGLIEQNFDAFTQNFENGGWDTWFQVTQNSQNNPYGAYLDAKNQLSLEIGNSQNKYQKQLDWGKGILSYEKCTERVGTVTAKKGSSTLTGTKKMVCKAGTYPLGSGANSGQCRGPLVEVTVDSNGNEITSSYLDFIEEGDVDDPDSGSCLESETVTPGSVINDQLTKALGSTWDNLEASDEINEIVGALMQQLTAKVVGGISSGLRGLSNSGSGSTSTNSSRTFLQQMTDATAPDSAETKQFKEGVDSLVPSDLGGTAAPMPTSTSKVDTSGMDPVKVEIVPGTTTNGDQSLQQ